MISIIRITGKRSKANTVTGGMIFALFGEAIVQAGESFQYADNGISLSLNQSSLYQGLAKGDKMELVIQKAVEIGVSDIFPVAMDHSVVVLEASKAGKKVERWQKIAEAAAKQSKRDIIPTVHQVMPLGQALQAKEQDLLLVAYESENQVSLKEVLQSHKEAKTIGVVIGPEGGLSMEEVEAAVARGGIAVSLGRRILRTETAGLVAATAILYETDNLGL